MPVGSTAGLDAIIPRYELPDTWAGKGACPVCRARGRLTVVHQSVTPDQMWCAACGAAFEVESGGAHLRLVRLPVTEPTATEAMLEQWVLPSELPALLAGIGSTPAPVAASPAADPVAEREAEPLAAVAAASILATPEAAAPVAEAPAAPTLTTFLNLPPKAKLNNSIRELLYGPDETGEPATGHAPLAPAETVTSPAATLLAHLRVEPPAEAAPAAPAMLEPAVLAVDEPVVLEPHSAALLSALLAELPAAPAPADEVSFLDSLAAQAAPATPPPAEPPSAPASAEPALAGDAASLLAQLLQNIPAAQAPADEAKFLDALAAGEAPADTAPTRPPAETGLMTTGGQAVAVPEVVIIVPNPPDPAELAARAAQLYQLGNSLTLIQAALERTGASADQVALAMRDIRAQDHQRLVRHAGTYRLLAGAGLVLVLLLIIVGAVSALRPVPTVPGAATLTPGGPTITPGGPTLTPTPAYNPIIALLNMLMPSDVKIVNGNTPTPGPTSEFFAQLFPPTATPQPATATALAATALSVGATAAAEATANHVEDGVPDWIKALVPEGITVVGVPTPAVEPAGPPNADCPFTAELAAALFGGAAADWSYDSENDGWFMTVLGPPVTVRVPLNMSAGYLVVGETFEFRNAHGPATISNINFVAISCEL